MTHTEYVLYLKSDQWSQKRQQRLAIDDYTCQMCGCKGTQQNPLQIHHFTYHDATDEDVYKSLVTVCRDCHKMIHKMMCRKTDRYGRRGWKSDLPTFVRPMFENVNTD